MEMPKPGDAHARLHTFAGQWGGEERVHPAPWDPEGGSATAFIHNRVVLDGFAVVQEYEQYRDGKPTFSGHGLFWWDEDAHQYVMTWFDSTVGTPSDFRGGFDGDVLRLVNERPQGGFARCTFDYGMPGEYVFMMEVSQDGEMWAPAMEGAYALLSGPTPRERKARAAERVATTMKARAKAASVKAPATRIARRKPAPAKASPRKAAAAKKATTKKTATKKAATKKAATKRAATRKAVARKPSKAAKKAARGKQ